jgi:hypothetical protein
MLLLRTGLARAKATYKMILKLFYNIPSLDFNLHLEALSHLDTRALHIGPG